MIPGDKNNKNQRQAFLKKQGSSYKNNYRNNVYDDGSFTGASRGGGGDYSEAGYRKPAGASYQRSERRTGRNAGTSARRGHSQRASAVSAKRRAAAHRRRRNKRIISLVLLILTALLLIFAIVFGIRKLINFIGSGDKNPATVSEAKLPKSASGEPETESAVSEEDRILAEANLLAAQYDYDKAIELIKSDEKLYSSEAGRAAVEKYEEIKSGLVRQEPAEITHVFFHSLVVDEENAFDKSKWGKQADGYNQVMTTVGEFEKMLDKFYESGFVLVGLHDIASMQKNEEGKFAMTRGEIMLPEGKRAMVMSQDDVCYYEYMKGAGFADRIIIGEDGKTTCHYTDSEGNEHVGEYDLVPILNRFVEEHPDFSYRGAKACLAFTGYNGILGYRTDETYDPDSDMYDSSKTANTDIEADREEARRVARALKDEGYELASHSWGHRNYTDISYEHMKKDADRWDKNVNKELLDGECDIILFPFGADVGDWRPYSHDNEKFDYLWDLGFRYFCNVDSAQYWVQIGGDYMRQGRRNLDGYAMWEDIADGKARLTDLFDASEIFSDKRPTPVLGY